MKNTHKFLSCTIMFFISLIIVANATSNRDTLSANHSVITFTIAASDKKPDSVQVYNTSQQTIQTLSGYDTLLLVRELSNNINSSGLDISLNCYPNHCAGTLKANIHILCNNSWVFLHDLSGRLLQKHTFVTQG